MKVKQRRVAIANTLLASNAPISGSELSNLFNVSRQIIVSDITELKRMGYAIQRRVAIANTLLASNAPISGSELSNLFNVSRQIIVSDITELKRMGYAIIATHHGYIMQKSPFKERVFKVKHTSQQTEEELNCIVNLGGTVVDVFVWQSV